MLVNQLCASNSENVRQSSDLEVDFDLCSYQGILVANWGAERSRRGSDNHPGQWEMRCISWLLLAMQYLSKKRYRVAKTRMNQEDSIKWE